MFESFPDVLTVAQLASALQIGTTKAYDLCHSGRFGIVQIGRKILIPKIFLLNYILSCDIIVSVTADNLTVAPKGVVYDR